MTESLAKRRYFPAALGIGSLLVFVALLELLIRVAIINRFIVPMPSDIIAAFPRVVVEEHVLQRFLLTAGEAFSASILVAIVGVACGAGLHRYHFLRLATALLGAALGAAPRASVYSRR